MLSQKMSCALTMAILASLSFIGAKSVRAEVLQDVKIRFSAEVSGKPFSCKEAYTNMGAAKSPVKFGDFRLFISELALLDDLGRKVPVDLDQDGIWQFQNVALLDFEDGQDGCLGGSPQLRDFISGRVPTGLYKGLSFTLGVPFSLNHADPILASSPLNLTSMFWTWQGGYKFLKLDILNNSASSGHVHDHSAHMSGSQGQESIPVFSLHLGSTGCQSPAQVKAPTSCNYSNRIHVEFSKFDPKTNIIVIDPASVLSGVNVKMNTKGTSPGCMSFAPDPECENIFPKLGLSYEGRASGQQSLFKVR
jgi:uncharacterized repeat protein (TIGR04052 family)